MVKNPPSKAGDYTGNYTTNSIFIRKCKAGSTPGLERFPGGGNGNPLQLFLPGKSHGERSLASPWCGKRLGKDGVTEQQHLKYKLHPPKICFLSCNISCDSNIQLTISIRKCKNLCHESDCIR